MNQMKVLVQEAVSAGIRSRVKIILFGRPVTERYCQIIAADMYAPDAIAAADLAEACCGTIHGLR
jgi:methanogenic corrinoid protein MtbC1